MIFDVTTGVMIAAPAEQVFDWLIDLDRYPLWNGGLLSLGRRGKMHEGMVFSTQSHAVGHTIESRVEVRRLLPNQELELINNTGAIGYRAVYRLIPADGQTEVVLWCQMEPQSRVFNLAKPLLESLAKARLSSYLQALKALCEAA